MELIIHLKCHGGGVKEGIYNNVIEGKNEFRILYIT